MHKPVNHWMNAIQVGFTIVGTVIGAGFASGQEILQFFVAFGKQGLWGLFLASLLFGVLTHLVVVTAAELRVRSHLELLMRTTSGWMARAVDGMLLCFLVISTALMLTGAGTVLEQHSGFNRMLGTVLAALIVVLVASGPSTSVVRFNVILVPVLIVTLCGLGGKALGQALKYSHVPTWKAAVNPYVTHWWMAALIYPAYNIFLAMSGLSSISGSVSPRSGVLGAWLGSGIIALLLVCVSLALWIAGPDIHRYPVPTLVVAQQTHPWLGWASILSMLAAMLTTAVVNVYGMARRLAEEVPWRHSWLTAALVALSLPLSYFEFVVIVGTAYSAIGYIALVFFGYWLLKLAIPSQPR